MTAWRVACTSLREDKVLKSTQADGNRFYLQPTSPKNQGRGLSVSPKTVLALSTIFVRFGSERRGWNLTPRADRRERLAFRGAYPIQWSKTRIRSIP
jgi:hypothetical protein